MENLSGLISILLQHSQRFLDFWNFQIVVSLGVLGFVLANHALIARLPVRILLTAVFLFIAIFSIFSLSAHQQREEKLWTALEARVVAAPDKFLPEDVAYIDSLKPTNFTIKAGAIIAADLLVVAVIWLRPKAAKKTTK